SCRLELEDRHLAGPGDGTVSVTCLEAGGRERCRSNSFIHRRNSAEAAWDRTAVSIFPDTPLRSTVRIEVPAGTKVSLRNIKLRPVGLKPVFNGKDLTGWKEIKTNRTKSEFTVTDKGELNIKNGPGDLQTEGQWGDFVLQLEIFSNGEHLNSGVF